MKGKRVLLVEDDSSICVVIRAALASEGVEVVTSDSVADRDRLLAGGRFDLMLTDVVLRDADGIATLASVRDAYPDLPVIVISAQNTLDTAVRASETGAFEYFPKPFDLDELVRAIRQGINSATPGSADEETTLPETAMPLVGRSAPMQAVYRMIARLLRNDLSVLVLGESGTGKELVAEAIHSLGHRKTGPFVAVNMAAIPADLIEAELFGHEKGAFTGAVAQAIGKFEQAQGGTLFLDEIGDMPMHAQTRLLRALQTGAITRVGGKAAIKLDVRIVAATNKDIPALIERGEFREDLYYRINVVPIELPPLRDRADDIEALVRHFLALAAKEGLPAKRIDAAAIEAMQGGAWRGNVRELRNFVYRLVVTAREDVIGEDAVQALLGSTPGAARPADHGSFEGAVRQLMQDVRSDRRHEGQLYDVALAAMEKPLLEMVMRRAKGNQLRAAALLGINRNTLRKKLADHAIKPGGAR